VSKTLQEKQVGHFRQCLVTTETGSKIFWGAFKLSYSTKHS